MHVVTVRFKVKPAHLHDFMELMMQNARDSLNKEAGCVQFDVCSDSMRPGDVFLYELYTDSSAFDLHLGTPHFKLFDQQTMDMIDSKCVTTFDRHKQ